MGGGLLEVALEEAVKWAVPGALAVALGWWAVKRKAWKEQREQKRQREKAFAEMVASYPEHQQTVAAILKEVMPNGGSSLADAVRRTERGMEAHGEVLQEVRGVLRTQSDLSDDGQFQCTATSDNGIPAGSNTFVNLTYARLLGIGKADLMGTQWKNYIHPDDAVAFLAANAAALAEHRPFNGRCRMVRSDGDVVLVEVVMYPDPEQPPAQRWFGRIREVK